MRQLLPFGRFLAVYRILQPEDNTVLRSGTIMQRMDKDVHLVLMHDLPHHHHTLH